MAPSFFDSIDDNPAPLGAVDPAHAQALLEDIANTYSAATRDVFTTHICLFERIVEGSSFLSTLLRRYPDIIAALEKQSAEEVADQVLDALPAAISACDNRDAVMVALRNARNQIALITALADITGMWDVRAVTACLSRLADQ